MGKSLTAFFMLRRQSPFDGAQKIVGLVQISMLAFCRAL